jgi:hypothetical protein
VCGCWAGIRADRWGICCAFFWVMSLEITPPF